MYYHVEAEFQIAVAAYENVSTVDNGVNDGRKLIT